MQNRFNPCRRFTRGRNKAFQIAVDTASTGLAINPETNMQKMQIKPGRGWRLLTAREKPNFKYGDEYYSATRRGWVRSSNPGLDSVATSIRESRDLETKQPLILAYRRRLNAKP